MAKFYKIDCNGVSKFVEVNNVKVLKKLKKDFDGKIVTKAGKPVEFNDEDIFRIQKECAGVGTSVDKVDINSIFKAEDKQDIE